MGAYLAARRRHNAAGARRSARHYAILGRRPHRDAAVRSRARPRARQRSADPHRDSRFGVLMESESSCPARTRCPTSPRSAGYFAAPEMDLIDLFIGARARWRHRRCHVARRPVARRHRAGSSADDRRSVSPRAGQRIERGVSSDVGIRRCPRHRCRSRLNISTAVSRGSPRRRR